MKRRTKIRLAALLLLLSTLLLRASACSELTNVSPEELSRYIQTNPEALPADDLFRKAALDFGAELLRRTAGEKNTLLSPVSVMTALAMTANGARENTLAQMERTLGMPVSELNKYLYGSSKSVSGDKYRLDAANSIWIHETEYLGVNKEFLQVNADWYGAAVNKAAFDEKTLKDINDWVNKKTDGMIPTILDEISPGAMMYLINAIAFDAEWQEPYEAYQVHNGDFTREDGSKQQVELMYSDEHTYLALDNGKGLMKPYAGGRYAFAALLPDEGVSMKDFLASLSGEKLLRAFAEKSSEKVLAAIPKFKVEYGTELSRVLSDMGMADAFGGGADFSGIKGVPGDIYISRVLHKTYMELDTQGTKAAAVTSVEMKAGAALDPNPPKEVYLNRPFVYMIVDCDSGVPVFWGVMYSIG